MKLTHYEITNYFLKRETSGLVEGINNKIKVLKRRCYGIFNLGHLFQRLFLDLEGYRLFAKMAFSNRFYMLWCFTENTREPWQAGGLSKRLGLRISACGSPFSKPCQKGKEAWFPIIGALALVSGYLFTWK